MYGSGVVLLNDGSKVGGSVEQWPAVVATGETMPTSSSIASVDVHLLDGVVVAAVVGSRSGWVLGAGGTPLSMAVVLVIWSLTAGRSLQIDARSSYNGV